MAEGDGEDNARPAPLWTAHFVRGLIDSASPLGVRWVDEQACDDPFARIVNSAQAALVRHSALERPDGSGKVVGPALAGQGRSPSFVWHAQAIGCLLELGYLPTTDAVRRHLDILEWRLDPQLLRNPAEVEDPNDPWILRTRHVAWVLACLAEMPSMKLDPHDEARHKANFDEAMNLHSKVILAAADYLLGLSPSHEWTGPDFEARAWREYWSESRPNLLNTVYATIGLARAMRHGFLRAIDGRADAVNNVVKLLDALLAEVTVTTRNGIPEVHWIRQNGSAPWIEPWAAGDLPDGVVGLLCLALLEYAGMLRETRDVYAYDDVHGAALRTKAQRLGHVLVFRGRDESRAAKSTTRWMNAAEAFLSEGAEGEWFVPSYSVCARAVLESGAATPRWRVVTDACATINGMALNAADNRGVETWIDPTRVFALRRRARNEGKESWHAKLDVTTVFEGGPDRPTDLPLTAAGIHAAAMALASARRAAARDDPRELLKLERIDELPQSPFTSFRLHKSGRKHTLELRGVGDVRDMYIESTSISTESRLVIEALAEQEEPASADEVLATVARLAGARKRRVTKQSGVEDRVDKINRQLGVEFILRDDSAGPSMFALHARLDSD